MPRAKKAVDLTSTVRRRSAYWGDVKGILVSVDSRGAHIKLRGSSQIVCVPLPYLDDTGWRKPTPVRASKPSSAPKGVRAPRQAKPKAELVKREALVITERVVSDLERYGHGVSIGKLTGSK